jgi:hypothetical protein
MGDPLFPKYDLPLYRPPSEARSLLIQATIGCSFNRCTFCSMYKGKAFRPRPLEEVRVDIAAAARMRPGTRRVFLADGDALCLPTEHLAALLDALAAALPRLQRVSLYATPIDVSRKSEAELRRLREKGLTLVYLGVESGSAAVLARVRKGANAQTIESGITRARAAGLAVSATVILGLGGRGLWREHIDDTARLINNAPCDYLSTLQLRLEDGAEGEFLARFKRGGEAFLRQDDEGILAEQERLIMALDPGEPIVFRSNHASNCLPLAGTLPDDRDRLLALVALARSGAPMLRPEPLRGL